MEREKEIERKKKKKKKDEEAYTRGKVMRAPQMRQAPIALNASLKQREMMRRDIRNQARIKDAQMEYEKRKEMAQRQMVQRQMEQRSDQNMRVQPMSKGKKA